MKTIAVAIDGPSGAGKSTIARAAAGHLGFVYVDTGAMYRTIGLAVCRAGVALGQTERIQSVLDSGIQVSLKYEQGVQHVLLDGEDVSASIRTPEMSKYASFVSAVPAVRAFLLQTQPGDGENAQCHHGRTRHRHRHFAGCRGQDFPDRIGAGAFQAPVY